MEYKIGNARFDSNEILEFYLDDREYVYRPRYCCNKSLVNKLSHKTYTYEKMVPFLPFSNDVNLEQVSFQIKLPNGAFEEEKNSVIKSSTKDYRNAAVRSIKCLIIKSDKEYCFYGNGIDCENVKLEYHKLQLMRHSKEGDGKAFTVLNKAAKKGEYSRKWYKGLSRSKKYCLLGATLLFLIFFIAVIGSVFDITEDLKEPQNTSDFGITEIAPAGITELSTEMTTEQTTDYSKMSTTTETVIATTSEITDEATAEISTETETEETTELYVAPLETEQKSGVIVYITPTGKKYHRSSACAGENAMPRDINDISSMYEPCKKCS